MTAVAAIGASRRRGATTAGGVPIPSGWALQRLDTFGTANSVPGPVRLHSLYNESLFWIGDGTGRVTLPNSGINNQQQEYEHFEDSSFNFMSDRLRIQGRGQAGGTIKSGQMVSKTTARSFIFESRFTVPATLGTWVTFWAYASTSGNDSSEFDVEFMMSMDGTTYGVHNVSLNNHPYAAPSADPVSDDSHFSFNSSTGLLFYDNASFDKTSGPHYYTIYYDDTGSGTVRRYIDGVLVYHQVWKWNQSLGGTGFGPDAAAIIDLSCGSGATGGQWPGTITSPSTWSGDMDIYSIGIYTPGLAGRAVPAGQCWNFNNKNASITLSNGDLTATTSITATQNALALDPVMSGTGKYYWEVVMTGTNVGAGVGTHFSSVATGIYLGQQDNHLGWFNSGSVVSNNAVIDTWSTFATGSRLCIALDMVNNKIWGRVGTAGNWDNAAIGSQNPATNTGGLTLPTQIRFNVVPGCCLSTSGDSVAAAFASGSWAGTPPSGFGQIGPT